MSGSGGESISSTRSLVLDLPPSCIEFCPAHPDLFVVGTYNLDKSERIEKLDDDGEEEQDQDEDLEPSGSSKQPQSRNGSIILFQLREGKVFPLQTVPQASAVFDLHFQPHPGRGNIFATVSSTGTISVFRLVVTDGGITSFPEAGAQDADIIQPISVLRVPDLDEKILFTYFAWHPSIPGLIAITTASGQVILSQIHYDYQGLDVLTANPVLEHSLEAWVVAFSPPEPSHSSPESDKAAFTLFSGGDDSALNYTSYDQASDVPTPYSPVTLRGHTAGVTAILPLPLARPHSGSHIVLTGSYDDTLRVFAIAPLHTTYGAKKARLLAECNLGGGVWRLNLLGAPVLSDDNSNKNNKWALTVLASCMHAGTRVLRVAGSDSGGGSSSSSSSSSSSEYDVEIEVLARFEEHKSMNYGSDWARDGDGRPQGTIVSTSFYDRLLCVWSMSR